MQGACLTYGPLPLRGGPPAYLVLPSALWSGGRRPVPKDRHDSHDSHDNQDTWITPFRRPPLIGIDTMKKTPLVMIGNGMAGVRTLEELLKIAPDLYDITVFGAEPRVTSRHDWELSKRPP